ncbi:MAG TPA: beta-galactosidase trimerization domain-containing protein [Vicinamibacterales bacterium]|nr:beta-galactosidase trimerization domain-containing protein [Vicinamibacterales bacterium]
MRRPARPAAFAALTLAVTAMVAAQRGGRENIDLDPAIAPLLGSPTEPISPEEYASRYRGFDGTVFVRVSFPAPADFRYRISVSAEVKPYGADFVDVGMFPPAPQSSYGPSEPSEWIRLPKSSNAGWNVNFTVRPVSGTVAWNASALHFDLAIGPSDDRVFRRVDEPLSSGLVATLFMPTTGGLAGLNAVMTDGEFARSRLRAAIRATRGLKAATPLRRLHVFTDTSVEPQRYGGGYVRPARAEIEFRIMQLLGVNSVGLGIESFEGLRDDDWQRLAPACGLVGTSFRAWCGMIPPGPHYDTGDTFPAIAAKYAAADHAAQAARFRNVLSFQIADTFITGDEIGPAIDPGWLGIKAIRTYFEGYLQAEGLEPGLFGVGSWSRVQPTIDRAVIPRSANDARRFYWFRRFANHVTALVSRVNTDAILKSYPHPRIVSSNFQAGPADFGFLGNSNDMDRDNVDIFELGRAHAFQGMISEDWVDTNDLGVGMVCFSGDVLRAAARKYDMPTMGYAVVGRTAPRIFAWLMQGARDVDLYTYGPVRRIGPALASDENDMRGIATATRLLAPFEDLIADGRVKTARAAMLVANASDIMQARGLYYGPERQQLYIALKHAYLHVDLLSEQDIVEDTLLSQYQVLFVSDPQVRTAAQRKIRDWVRGGGHLWAEVGAAGFDEYSQPSAILDDVLGVRSRTMNTGDGWPLKPIDTWYQSRTKKFNFRSRGTFHTDGTHSFPIVDVPVWGAKMDAVASTGTVVGRYDTGEPAVVYNEYGKGDALLVGALVGEAYARGRWANGTDDGQAVPEGGSGARTIAAALASRSGVVDPLTSSAPGMYTSLIDGPRGAVAFVVNLGSVGGDSVEMRARVSGGVVRVRSGESGPLAFHRDGDQIVVTYPRRSSLDLVSFEYR